MNLGSVLTGAVQGFLMTGNPIGAGVGAMSASNTTPKQVDLGNAPWDRSGQ